MAGRSWAWLRDPWLVAALVAGLVVRVLPLMLFLQFECIRDECIYRTMAADIANGQGLTLSDKGWLPSPGYPYLLAWSKVLFDSMQPVKLLQIVLSLVSVALVYGIGREVADRRVARISAFLLALNPTIAWFTNTMWIETIYIFFLLSSAYAMLIAWRNGRWGPAVVSGIFLGGAVLFRGVATYLPPFWILAMLYPVDGDVRPAAWWRSLRHRWRHVIAFLVAAVLVVAPYSIYASRTYGGFLVTDATVGHVLHLGNNDYPPLTFDFGNGMLTEPLYAKWRNTGRKFCDRNVPPTQSSQCEVEAAVAWIRAHPDTFVARIPLRLAQMLNPNSFLTRHVRWGYWPGLPWWAKETIAVTIVLFSVSLCTFGTLAAWARARGPYAMMAVGTTLYTLLTIMIMYGMTRFRLPLEALWTVYLAMFLANPKRTFAALWASSWRLAGALITLPAIVVLICWFLPTGFPVFW
jgi:4-amino-4-deoxy-L-arabinose transferase-like glycosyltransferase